MTSPTRHGVPAVEIVVINSGHHAKHFSRRLLGGFVFTLPLITDVTIVATNAKQSREGFHHARQTRGFLALENLNILEDYFGYFIFPAGQSLIYFGQRLYILSVLLRPGRWSCRWL